MTPEEKSLKRLEEILAADAKVISEGFAEMKFGDYIKFMQLPFEWKAETA